MGKIKALFSGLKLYKALFGLLLLYRNIYKEINQINAYMAKKLFLMVFLVLFSYSVFGAEIHGSVYDLNLDKISDVVVTVNTEPKQTFVVKNGSYLFNVPSGDYVIAAVYKNGYLQEAVENISVAGDGSYVLDLILFPSLDEEEDIIEETNIEFDDENYFKKASYWPTLFSLIGVVVILGFFIYFYKPKKEIIVKEIKEEKGELKSLVDFIKKQGGRTTQKDIRKEFPSSEAKISLMITELEKKNKIQRIKKGRGNVIILK